MAAAIRDAHPDADLDLVKGGKGDFIVTVREPGPDREIWNKNATGKGFPKPEQILAELPGSA